MRKKKLASLSADTAKSLRPTLCYCQLPQFTFCHCEPTHYPSKTFYLDYPGIGKSKFNTKPACFVIIERF